MLCLRSQHGVSWVLKSHLHKKVKRVHECVLLFLNVYYTKKGMDRALRFIRLKFFTFDLIFLVRWLLLGVLEPGGVFGVEVGRHFLLSAWALKHRHPCKTQPKSFSQAHAPPAPFIPPRLRPLMSGSGLLFITFVYHLKN